MKERKRWEKERERKMRIGQKEEDRGEIDMSMDSLFIFSLT